MRHHEAHTGGPDDRGDPAVVSHWQVDPSGKEACALAQVALVVAAMLGRAVGHANGMRRKCIALPAVGGKMLCAGDLLECRDFAECLHCPQPNTKYYC